LKADLTLADSTTTTAQFITATSYLNIMFMKLSVNKKSTREAYGRNSFSTTVS